MMNNGQPLGNTWKQRLDLRHRLAPDLFESGDEVHGTPYADAVRTALDDLGLSAMFCVNGVPTIAIIRSENYEPASIMNTQAALWNQGLASVLAVISGDLVRVFSLAKMPITGNDSGFEDRCLIDTLDATTSVLKLQSLFTGAETGRLWREEREYFRPGDRIDAVLLNNLEQAHTLLIDANLTSDQAQAILIQTMFVAYLEDRKIIGPDYFRQTTEGKADSWSGVLALGNADHLDGLFNQLRRDFNGDLFVAPCSFSEHSRIIRLTQTQLQILDRFRLGREEMQGSGAQLRFWGYDFRFIPVELISAVYDRFLGKDMAKRRQTGAFYTPMFLADSVVTSTWASMSTDQKENATFLDPACGSGVFLVRSFQRLCEHWRETRSAETIRWDSLKKMISRIHGRDVNSGAVRVAVFSVYLALLEQVSPPDLRKLIEKKGLLPPLWGKTLIARDFFEEDPDKIRYDIIIGNPPWTSRKGIDRMALAWSYENGYPVPQGEEAWAFTWKALRHLNASGLISFLLPAMGFLHNHAAASVDARKRLFREAHVKLVINFSDLRFQLFDGAIRPATLFVISNLKQYGTAYEFQYWTPKADLNLAIKRFVTLSPADRTPLLSSDVLEDSLIFKHRLWMRGPESKLYSFLSRLPKLGDRIMSSRHGGASDRAWIIGQGFQPYNGGRSTSVVRESDRVGVVPYLSIGQFTTLAIDPSIREPWPSRQVRRRGFEPGFEGPRILVPRGVQTSRWRLRASYIERPLTFQDILQAITVPEKEKSAAKLLTAILNSRVALWYAFHGTASFGADRPEVKQAELMRLPFPNPDDMADPKGAEEARDGLIKIVDESQNLAKQFLTAPNAEDELLRRIDELTYTYFGLTDDEITLIEDAADYIIPAAQPSAGSFPSAWNDTVKADRQAYAQVLTRRLGEWFNSGARLSARLITRNLDFAILCISFGDERTQRYKEDTGEAFSETLSQLSEALGQSINENFVLLPDVRIFIGSNLYLIKPLQKRFWLRSTALADADSIAIDLDSFKQSKKARGMAS